MRSLPRPPGQHRLRPPFQARRKREVGSARPGYLPIAKRTRGAGRANPHGTATPPLYASSPVAQLRRGRAESANFIVLEELLLSLGLCHRPQHGQPRVGGRVQRRQETYARPCRQMPRHGEEEPWPLLVPRRWRGPWPASRQERTGDTGEEQKRGTRNDRACLLVLHHSPPVPECRDVHATIVHVQHEWFGLIRHYLAAAPLFNLSFMYSGVSM